MLPTSASLVWPVLLCTKAKSREIERNEYQDIVDENNKRVDENLPLYKTRQQIIEHPFGTIKRSWGYTYTLLKGIKKVNGEIAIIFTMYNIRRAMSILGVKELISRLKAQKASNKSQKAGILRCFEPYYSSIRISDIQSVTEADTIKLDCMTYFVDHSLVFAQPVVASQSFHPHC
ncbi:MAG: transposase [Segetibacter sp.]